MGRAVLHLTNERNILSQWCVIMIFFFQNRCTSELLWEDDDAMPQRSIYSEQGASYRTKNGIVSVFF